MFFSWSAFSIGNGFQNMGLSQEVSNLVPVQMIINYTYTPSKTNMTMENQHFFLEMHLQMVGFAASQVSFPDIYIYPGLPPPLK